MRKKCPYLEFFWSVFSRMWTEYSVSLRIQPECGKIRTRKTQNTDTFHAVKNLGVGQIPLYQKIKNLRDGGDFKCEFRQKKAIIFFSAKIMFHPQVGGN